jgi:glycosyltransferase involved in cell wall biosynthesis
VRLGFVTPWKGNDALSNYSASLIPHLVNDGTYRIFAEHADDVEEEDNVVRCWRRGEPLDDLIGKVLAFEPDVVLIEHQYALFPDQAEWLSFLSVLRAKVFVRMHSVYTTPLNLLGIMETPKYLSAVPNILVHTEEARKALALRNVPSDVIPHGIGAVEGGSLQTKPYLFSFGFGAHYKGLENAIEVVKILKRSFQDVMYIGVFGDEPRRSVASKVYMKKVLGAIEDENLEDHFIVFEGYKPINTLKRFAQWCSVALFTYNRHDDAREVYGASGAARLAISWGLPVVTSNAPLFSDLEVASGSNPAEIADKVRTILYSDYARDQALARQKEVAERQSWANVGAMHLKLFGN